MNRIRTYILQAVARILEATIDTDEIRRNIISNNTTETLADIEANGLTQADTDLIDAELTRRAEEEA